MMFWSFCGNITYQNDNFCFVESLFQLQIKLISTDFTTYFGKSIRFIRCLWDWKPFLACCTITLEEIYWMYKFLPSNLFSAPCVYRHNEIKQQWFVFEKKIIRNLHSFIKNWYLFVTILVRIYQKKNLFSLCSWRNFDDFIFFFRILIAITEIKTMDYQSI